MSQIINNGVTYSLAEFNSVPTKLPNKVFNFRLNPQSGEYYLEETNPITLPKKIYGDMSIVDRYIKSYHNTERNLGVLLAGLKGNGKTVMAKYLCQKLDQPIILINEPFKCADCAIQFLTNPVLGNCTVFIDEFEKVFADTDEQLPILSLLDGPYQTHHFFILTVNDKFLNKNLINRPSRIHYVNNFARLDSKIVEEIANDLVNDKTQIPSVIELVNRIPDLSMDILITIIKDMNLFNESANEVYAAMGLTIEVSSINFVQKFKGDDFFTVVRRSAHYSSFSENNSWWLYHTGEEYEKGSNEMLVQDVDLNKLELVSPGVYNAKKCAPPSYEGEIYIVLDFAIPQFDAY